VSHDKNIHSIVLDFGGVGYLRRELGDTFEDYLQEFIGIVVEGCRYARDEMGKTVMICISLDVYLEDEENRRAHLLAKRVFESERFSVYPSLGASIKALSNLYKYKARCSNS